MDKHGADPQEALHVGDSLREDIEGATKAGLRALLLDRHGDPGVPHIRTLDQILPYVSGL